MIRKLGAQCRECFGVVWNGTCECGKVTTKLNDKFLIVSSKDLSDFDMVWVWLGNGKIAHITPAPHPNYTTPSKLSYKKLKKLIKEDDEA